MMGIYRRRTKGGHAMPDSRRASMGHPVAPEKMWHPRGEEGYAGPEDARRDLRKDRPVAVVGASADRTKFGNKAVRAYLDEGYTVWPVNPRGEDIEGVHAYAGLRDLPDQPFLVSIYLHEDAAISVLDEIADLERERGRQVAVVYLNPGADTALVRRRAEELGLFAVPTCSIRAIGRDPGEFGDDGQR